MNHWIRTISRRGGSALVATLLAVLLTPTAALACGGFFCFTQPIDQSAERILYIRNSDSITVHIQISYTGDDEQFSWVLPLMSVPQLGIGSDSVFPVLEQLTSPRFQLDVQNKQGCYLDQPCMQLDAAADGGGGGPAAGGGGVQILLEEKVGPYDAKVISGDDGAEMFQWLNDNGYVQPPEAQPLIESYVDNKFVFLALKLQKDKSVGDLAPIVVTLDENEPCLPIRLTKIAASDDMPIVAWFLGEHRAIPKNYLHVEINEATIDWFNPSANYKAVVSKAIDQASGHAFTTEYAKPNKQIQPWQQNDPNAQPVNIFDNRFELQNADTAKLAGMTEPGDFLQEMFSQGFPRNTSIQNMIRKYMPKADPYADVSDNEFYGCIQGYQPGQGEPCDSYYASLPAFDAKAFAQELQEVVVEPLAAVQKSFGDLPYLTRLYTTLDASEMDKDPIFSFNPDLPDVDNLHVAVAEPICAEGEQQAKKAKLTFADGRELEVDVPTDVDNCFGFGFGGSGQSVGFGDGGAGAINDAGGQPAKEIAVLDEQGPPLVVAMEDAERVDGALNNAEAGKPSLDDAFVDSLDDPAPTANASNNSGGGCTASPTGAPASSGAGFMLLLVGAAFLARRRRAVAP